MKKACYSNRQSFVYIPYLKEICDIVFVQKKKQVTNYLFYFVFYLYVYVYKNALFDCCYYVLTKMYWNIDQNDMLYR